MSVSSSSTSSSGPNFTGMQTLSEMTGGINYSQIISELYNAEMAPAQALDQNIQTDQLYINDWSNISNLATTVQNDLVTLANTSTYNSFNATTTGSVASASTLSTGATPGTYNIVLKKAGSNATMESSSSDGAQGVSGAIGSPIENPSSTTLSDNVFSQAISAGTVSFTYNGQNYSYTVNPDESLSDTLSDLSNLVSGGAVTFSYSSTTNTISVSNSGSGQLVLGSPGDSSNFFQALGLNGNTANAGGSTTSSLVGVAQLQQSLQSSNLAGNLTNGSGSMTINGVAINYNTSSDSLESFMQSINSSTAGVTASYDPIADKMILTSKSAQPITVQNGTGSNLATVLGLCGTSAAGSNWVYTVGTHSGLSSPSATVQNIIPGVNFTFTNSTGTGTLTVSQNTDTLTKAVTQFVGDFNNLYTQIQQYTGKNGDLSSDSQLNDLGTQMMDDVLSPIQAAINAGYAQNTAMGIGINTGPIGSAPGTTNSLQFDASTLIQQFNTNPSEVQTILQGIANTLNNDLTVYTGSFNSLTPTSVIASFGQESVVQAQTDMYNADITNFEQEQTDIENTASSYEQNLTTEFTALQQYQQQMSMEEEEMSALESSSSTA